MAIDYGRPLNVYLGSELVGELTRPGSGRIRFQYTEDIAERLEGEILLSASLPVRTARYSNSEAKPFFEGLLPEGAVRQRVADELHVSYANTFALLAKIGVECAGAAVIVPQEEEPPHPDEAELQWLSDEELYERVLNVRNHPLGIEPGRVRLSLGGVQDKLVLVRSPPGRFALPLHGAPSTHILKPNQEQYEDIVANEAYCLRVAACSRFFVARSEVVRVGNAECLVVERFDRTIGQGNRVERLHQEDFCQALGVLPESKYETEGGPSAEAVASALRTLSTQPAADVLAFVRALVLNYLIGNSDAHGKNFGLLYDPVGRARLAPLYDLVCTSVYDVEQALAMSIGGVFDPDEVSSSSWSRLARDCGLSEAAMSRYVGDVAERVARCATVARDQAIAENWHRPVINRIHHVSERRADGLLPR